MSKQVLFKRGTHPVQVGFPDGVERSRVGSVYFYPGAVEEITLGEFAYIRDSKPDMFASLVDVTPPAAAVAQPVVSRRVVRGDRATEPDSRAVKQD